MNYKIAICDDSSTDRDYIADFTRQWARENAHTIDLTAFPSAESFLFAYAEQKDWDILLLDIEMGTMDGVSLARKLRQGNERIQIIFITGFPDFMAEGYEVSALHYLMKPVKEAKLAEVLSKAARNLNKNEKDLIFTVKGEALRLGVREILWVEAFAHSCRVAAAGQTFEVSQSISELEKLLGAAAVRTHRSYLAGLAHIRRISRTEVILDNGDKIPLSRYNYQGVNQAFIKYYRGEGTWDL